MFALVRFNDWTKGIYPMKNVRQIGNTCIVKYRGSHYEGCILETGSYEKLNKQKLMIRLQKLPIETFSSVICNNVQDVYTTSSNSPKIADAAHNEDISLNENISLNSQDVYTTNSNLPKIADATHDEDISLNENISLNSQDVSFASDLLDIDTSNSLLVTSCNDICGDESPNGHDRNMNNYVEEKKNDEVRVSNSISILPSCSVDSDNSVTSDPEPFDDDDSVDDPNYEPNDAENDIDDLNFDDNEATEQVHTENTSQFETSKNGSYSFNNSSTVNGCDDANMYVANSRGKAGDKKFNFCYYCNTKQQKIARHLELRHKDIDEVQKFLHLPKGNLERRQIIAQIRKKGNFLFNTNENFNDGELVVARRPQSKLNKRACDFRACANCKGFFSKTSLRVHFKICTGRSSKSHHLVSVLSKKVMGRIHKSATSVVKNQLFPPLREDNTVRQIRYDELVILYANKMVEKYRNPRHFEMIRQRLRLIGRYLVTLKKLNKDVTDLSSVFDPKFCDDTIKAINIEARFNTTTCCFETPTVAFSLGTYLKYIGNLLLVKCIKEHDRDKKQNTKDFIKLLIQELNIGTNRTVAESQLQIKRRKTVMLPSTEDIKKLHNYLRKNISDSYATIQKQFSISCWRKLAENTLISILVFNRRRAGEVERILIEDFQRYKTVDENTDKDIFDSLSADAKEIAQKYVRFEIRGKLNRTVPVLLDNTLLACMKLIINSRLKTGVSSANPYVFGVPSFNKNNFNYLRACNLLRKFSEECGAEHPERLRGTKLRKHIATKCITLNLEAEDVSDLANFMGHAENIHRNIYRQPVLTREILRMSQLLEAAQGVNKEGNDLDSDGSDSIHDENQTVEAFTTTFPSGNATPQVEKRKSSYGSIKRTRWTDEEKQILENTFQEHISNNTYPSLKEIEITIAANPQLQHRTSPQIKTWFSNFYLKRKRLSFQ